MNVIKYRDGYKYQLANGYAVQTAVFPPRHIATDFIILATNGMLIINQGYAWDGCSGPTWDDKTNMRAGLVHDALFQLMRNKLLDVGWRHTADDELRRICKEDGMSAWRAWYYWKAVRMFGESSAEWQEDEVLTAP